MSGKKPVEDDPQMNYIRKRGELDKRVANKEITLDEVNLGLQAILEREFELTWKEGIDKKIEEELIRQIKDLMFKIQSEVEDGQRVEIAERNCHRIVANVHGFQILHPEGFPTRIIPLRGDIESSIILYKLELRDLRKILRDLRNKKKAKADRLSLCNDGQPGV